MPHFIDFEASGLDLGKSYPIEVGFCDETGSGDSWLIKPDSEWLWWDPSAEGIHKIKRSELKKSGLEPVMIASILNATLKTETVYCDGHRYDAYWLNELFRVANLRPTFQLGNYSSFIQQEILNLPISVQKKQKKWKAFVGEYYSKKEVIQHRALADCQRLARLYKTHC